MLGHENDGKKCKEIIMLIVREMVSVNVTFFSSGC